MSAKTSESVVRYYRASPDYLDGPLQGTCHFGFTPSGKKFNLEEDLHSMETLLGRKLGLPPGSLVGDGGSGFGRVATRMSREFGLRVLGADLIPERLVEAKRFVAENHASDKVNILNANYGFLPVRSGALDGFYTMETLVHADPLHQALGEFRRVLRPGGRLVLFEYSVPPRESLDPLRKMITDHMIRRTGMASIEKFTHGAFPKILQDAHFENITVEDISKNVWPMWRWLFVRAIREHWPAILSGQFMKKTNLAASLFIWPYRHHLGYKVVTATKPLHE